jgi:PTS system nitrogen regulatory IIA component
MKQLHEYMDPAATYFTSKSNKDEILEEMVTISYEAGKVPDFDEFKAAIFEREMIMSTGIGLGVAVPHAKLPSIGEFFITTGILRQAVDWQAIDDLPVSVVFLIGGPDDRQKDYLRILSKLVLFSKNQKRREALLQADSPEEVITHFKPHE